MIAHLNLFRGQMIDHRKQFDGEVIALLTAKLIQMSDHLIAKTMYIDDSSPTDTEMQKRTNGTNAASVKKSQLV